MKFHIRCERCNKMFAIPDHRIDTARFCSRKCRRHRVEKTCPVCAKTFSVKFGHAPDRVTCSRGCRATLLRTQRQREIERKFDEPIETLLRRLYYGEKMGIRAVARHVGVSSRNLWEWFEDIGIERRSRSEAVSLQWEGNNKRRAAASTQLSEWLKENVEDPQAHSLKANLIQQSMKKPSGLERRMMRALDKAGVKYKSQFAVGGKFLCDFAVLEADLIIECDGDYWHGKRKQQVKDTSKNAYLRACGYTVLRFRGFQIKYHITSCIATIESAVNRLAK